MQAVGAALIGLALAAGCDPAEPAARCPVPGLLGVGGFAIRDCPTGAGCVGWGFAAGAVETVELCLPGGQTVTEVVSSDPAVMVTSEAVALGPGLFAFDLAAGAPGVATVEVRGPEVVERLELVVEDLAGLVVEHPPRLALGGSAAVTSIKAGGAGTPLFGRGGYDVAVPAGLSVRAATTATQDCGLAQPDVVITGDALGVHEVRTAPPAPAWTGTIDVVPVAAITALTFTTTRLAGNPSDGYGASVRVIGRDADDRPVVGVACEWSSSRPVFIANNVCWSLVLVPTDEPLDLTCTVGGRALGSVRLTNALVL